MRDESRGFTLMEVVIALFLIAVGVIATAPLFVYAMQENAGGGDMGTVGAAAVPDSSGSSAAPPPESVNIASTCKRRRPSSE